MADLYYSMLRHKVYAVERIYSYFVHIIQLIGLCLD